MRAKLQKCIYMSILFVLIGNPVYALTDFAKATIVVLDERNNPVEGAYTGITFETNTGQGTKVSTKDGSPDADGKFVATGSCNGHIAYGAKKTGYYDSNYAYDFKGKNAFGWEPWNPELTVVLRKIENPVPMYARQAKIELPVSGKDAGFDLVEYDWVVPYGKGKHSDLIFNLKSNVVDKNEFDSMLTIKFSDRYDGIQQYKEDLQYGSRLKLPKISPDVNFKDTLILHEWKIRGEYTIHKNFDFYAKDLNYLFRVRSFKEDKDGKKIRSMYGKIIGSIKFDAVFSKTGTIRFLYYLNPDYTRNLEFDPKRNLFGSLSDSERVTEP